MEFVLNTEAPPDSADEGSSSEDDGVERESEMYHTAPVPVQPLALAQPAAASGDISSVSDSDDDGVDGNMTIRFDGGSDFELPLHGFDMPLQTTGKRVEEVVAELCETFANLDEHHPGCRPELRIGNTVLKPTGRLCDLRLNLELTHTITVSLVKQTEAEKILAAAPTKWPRLQAASRSPRGLTEGHGEKLLYQMMETLDDAASEDRMWLERTVDELIEIARRSGKITTVRAIVKHVETYGFLRQVYHERLIQSKDMVKECFQSFETLMSGDVDDKEFTTKCHESAFCATEAELFRCLLKQPPKHILGKKVRRSLDGKTGDEFERAIDDLDRKARKLEDIADSLDQQPGTGEYKIRQQYEKHGKLDDYKSMKSAIIQAAGFGESEPLRNLKRADGTRCSETTMKNMQKAYRKWSKSDNQHSEYADKLAGMVTPEELERQCDQQIRSLEAKADTLPISEARRIIEDHGCALADQKDDVHRRVQRSVYDTVLSGAEVDLLCATETMIVGANTYNCHHPRTVKVVHDERNRQYNPFVLQGRFPNGCGCEGCGRLFACERDRRDNKMIESFDYTCPESQARAEVVNGFSTIEEVRKFAKQFDCWHFSFGTIGEIDELKYEVLGTNIRQYMIACKKQSLVNESIELLTKKAQRCVSGTDGDGESDFGQVDPQMIAEDDDYTDGEKKQRLIQIILDGSVFPSGSQRVLRNKYACTGSPCICTKQNLDGKTLEKYEDFYLLARLLQDMDNRERGAYLEQSRKPIKDIRPFFSIRHHAEAYSTKMYVNLNTIIQDLRERNDLPWFPRTWTEYKAIEQKSRLCHECFSLYFEDGPSRKMTLPLTPGANMWTEDSLPENGTAPMGIVDFLTEEGRSQRKTFKEFYQHLHAIRQVTPVTCTNAPAKRESEDAGVQSKPKKASHSMQGQFDGQKCEECQTVIKGNADYKRLCRDLYLFSVMLDVETIPDGVIVHTKAKALSPGGKFALKGWKSKHADIDSGVLDPVLAQLKGERIDIPGSWEEYKGQMRTSGSLCPECWKIVCVEKNFK